MQLSTIAFLTSLVAFATAAPTVEAPVFDAVMELSARAPPISGVFVFNDDVCGGQPTPASTTIVGSGSERCVLVVSARSVKAAGHGCKVHIFSGTNWQGIKVEIKDTECHSNLFGSYLSKC